MKGEYVEEENEPNNETSRSSNPHHTHTQPHHPHPHSHTMFAKFSPHPFHPHHLQPPPPPPPHFPPPHLHSHPPFSEEADSPTPPHHLLLQHSSSSSKKPKITPPSNTTITTTQTQTTTTTSNEDHCGTIEVSRRPRGRPPGSKNKPKPPVVITRDPEPAMSPYILELPSGADVVDSLTRFTRRRSIGLCVLTASGAVANVTLKQPSTTTPGGTVTFHGRFDILSLSAVVAASNTTPYNGSGGGFTITLAGPQGQIVGGKVVGSLVCSGTVYVIAASFNNPSYCRLPLDDSTANNNNNHHQQQQHDTPDDSGGGGGGGGGGEGNSPVSGGGGTMSLYSGHLGAGRTVTTSAASGDVIWASNPSSVRQPY